MYVFYLYRLFDSEGNLLYAGISGDWTRRMREHWRTKPWAAEIFSVLLETYPDLPAVLAAERRAIQAEAPLYNIHHNRHIEDDAEPEATLSAEDLFLFLVLAAVAAYVLYRLSQAAMARYRAWKVDRAEFREWQRTRQGQAGDDLDQCGTPPATEDDPNAAGAAPAPAVPPPGG